MGESTADIVAGAVQEAEAGGLISDSPDTSSESGGEATVVDISGDGDGGGAAETAVSPSSAAPQKSLASAVDETAKKQADEIAELAKFGITPPKPGQREGTFKWSKVQRVLENARKKVAEKYEKDLRERDDRLRQHEMALKNHEAANKLIATDPRRYLEMLSVLNPDYKQYLTPVEARQAARTEVPKQSEPPPPDARFEDGSLGYSPEGLQKLMAYHEERGRLAAVEAVKAEYEQRFGPMEKDWKRSLEVQAAEARVQQVIPVVRDQIANAKKMWGAAFKSKLTGDPEDDPEILKTLADHPDWSFDACVSHVLLPRMQTDRQTMRQQLLDEIHKAPAAAMRSVPGTGGSSGTGAPRTTADIVAEAVRAAGG